MKSQRKCTLFYISFIVLFIFYDALCFMKLLPFQFGNVISLKGRWSVIVIVYIDSIITIAMFRFRFTQPLLCCGNASADTQFLLVKP